MHGRTVFTLACAGAIFAMQDGQTARGAGIRGGGGSVRYAARTAALARTDDNEAWNAGFGSAGPAYSTAPKDVATVSPSAGPRASFLPQNRLNDGSIQNAAGSGRSSGPVPASSGNPVWLLVKMSGYLAEQQQFTMWIDVTSERVSESGQKIQLSNRQVTYVQRPDKLAVEIDSSTAQTRIVYDGTGVTAIDTKSNMYGIIPVSGGLDSVLDTLASRYGMAVPADDLLYKGAYERLKKKIRAAQDLGIEDLDGVSCYHVMFEGNDVDCQIWFQVGREAIPRKVVIFYKNAPGRPRCTLEITRWESGPISAAVFKPDVPAGARQISIVPR